MADRDLLEYQIEELEKLSETLSSLYITVIPPEYMEPYELLYALRKDFSKRPIGEMVSKAYFLFRHYLGLYIPKLEAELVEMRKAVQ